MNGIVIENKKGVDEKDFTSLSWVLRARSRDEERPVLCGVSSDGMGRFAATDGHRLHVAEIPKLSETIPKGVWLYVHGNKKKISLEQTDGLTFPDFQKVFDDFNNAKPTNKGMVNHVKGEDSGAVWRLHDITDMTFNIKYALEMLSGIEPLSVRICSDYLHGIEFSSQGEEGNTKRGIIMPLKDNKVS
jgi:hypothetical protein